MQNAKVIQDVRNLVDSLSSTGFVEPLNSIRSQVSDLLLYIDETIKSVGGEAVVDALNDKNEDSHQKDSNQKEFSYYNPSRSLIERFIFVLKAENRFLHFREAALIIRDLEGKGDIDDLTKRLSNATRKLKKSGKLTKVQHDSSLKNTFWGLTKWLNEDGTIKEGYEYKTDILDRDKEDDSIKDPFFDL
ncbi:hypothetical protein [Muricauda sp. MAR_2010_75]|uniref:hypothetical protein n=1 Tax=Allomuricauda sp. MAR_2010_75 TaxID=1250232 RepID=UPI0005681FEE|nr:hypothetical protein [Muricauda sp. MAR_2010_75]